MMGAPRHTFSPCLVVVLFASKVAGRLGLNVLFNKKKNTIGNIDAKATGNILAKATLGCGLGVDVADLRLEV